MSELLISTMRRPRLRNAKTQRRPRAARVSAQKTSSGRPLENSTRLNTLFHILPDWVFLLRRDGLILDYHVPQEPSTPAFKEEITGRKFTELLPNALARQSAYYLEKAFQTRQLQVFTAPLQWAGEQRDYRVRIISRAGDEALALIHDVTNEKLREKEIVEITSREQTRIGQDIHDGLGQHLTGISFLSRALEQKLLGRSLPEAKDAAEICRLVIQTLSHSRSLARGLFPVELEGHGLVSALKELATEIEKVFGVTCIVECPEDLVIEDRVRATHLFRLAQEAMNNSMKHGKARRIVVRLERLNGSAALSISDDGIGLRDSNGPNHGLGLRIMNYRAQKLGGALDISVAPSGGVSVRCTFPYVCHEHAPS